MTGVDGRRRFERWSLRLDPGEQRPTSAAEWAGAFVVIERGVLQVDCLAGGSRTFAAGDQLALGWLPLRTLRNVGDGEVRLSAVRRGPTPDQPFLHLTRTQGVASKR
ncbi:MAG: hypothetical protein K5924_03770 [Chloroflexi bacterium]|nr:hypothetical protein [Chloroflexota bacterium]